MRARIGRTFPRGWRDFVWQLGIWFGFFFAYQVARGVADRNPVEAFENGRHVIEAQQAVHALVEPDLQNAVVRAGEWLIQGVNMTYWLSQFVVLGIALLWIYFRRNDAFYPVRNWVLATNVVALVGYVLMPTAPPRLFPEEGFVDTLAVFSGLNHESGFVQLASNPYAAMPSVHAADALVIGFAMATLVKSRWAAALWTLWPTWVWFSVMASGNHFWLDIAAGVGVAAVAAAALARVEGRSPAQALAGQRRW